MCGVTGEMEKHTGEVRMGGRLAYVAQQAWIVNDSLQKNVLFGHDLEPQRWDSTVHACSLQQDLEVSFMLTGCPQVMSLLAAVAAAVLRVILYSAPYPRRPIWLCSNHRVLS